MSLYTEFSNINDMRRIGFGFDTVECINTVSNILIYLHFVSAQKGHRKMHFRNKKNFKNMLETR